MLDVQGVPGNLTSFHRPVILAILVETEWVEMIEV